MDCLKVSLVSLLLVLSRLNAPTLTCAPGGPTTYILLSTPVRPPQKSSGGWVTSSWRPGPPLSPSPLRPYLGSEWTGVTSTSVTPSASGSRHGWTATRRAPRPTTSSRVPSRAARDRGSCRRATHESVGGRRGSRTTPRRLPDPPPSPPPRPLTRSGTTSPDLKELPPFLH